MPVLPGSGADEPKPAGPAVAVPDVEPSAVSTRRAGRDTWVERATGDQNHCRSGATAGGTARQVCTCLSYIESSSDWYLVSKVLRLSFRLGVSSSSSTDRSCSRIRKSLMVSH